MISLALTSFAHPGRTDSKGGHWNRKTGTYHYHNGGGSSSNSSSQSSSYSAPKYATRVNITNIPTKIDVGENMFLKASVYPSDADDDEITWESSNPKVAHISSSGWLTAEGLGTAIITAKTSRGTSKSFTITITEVVAKGIDIITDDNEILLGDTKILECEFTPENTTYKTVDWSSSNESVISVSENGEIFAGKIGVATITARHKKFTDSITIEVKPIDAENIEIILPSDIETNDELQPILKKGSQLKLEAEVYPTNTTYKEIKWSVNDDSIGTIDQNGVITAHSTGNLIVTATAKSGVTEKIEIEVYSHTATIIICSLTALVVGIVVIYSKIKKRRLQTGDGSLSEEN